MPTELETETPRSLSEVALDVGPPERGVDNDGVDISAEVDAPWICVSMY